MGRQERAYSQPDTRVSYDRAGSARSRQPPWATTTKLAAELSACSSISTCATSCVWLLEGTGEVHRPRLPRQVGSARVRKAALFGVGDSAVPAQDEDNPRRWARSGVRGPSSGWSSRQFYASSTDSSTTLQRGCLAQDPASATRRGRPASKSGQALAHALRVRGHLVTDFRDDQLRDRRARHGEARTEDSTLPFEATAARLSEIIAGVPVCRSRGPSKHREHPEKSIRT